jgi:hypothetical protein
MSLLFHLSYHSISSLVLAQVWISDIFTVVSPVRSWNKVPQIDPALLPVHWLVHFLRYSHEMGSTLGLYQIEDPQDISGTSWCKTACRAFDRIYRSISVLQWRQNYSRKWCTHPSVWIRLNRRQNKWRGLKRYEFLSIGHPKSNQTFGLW